MRLWLSLVTVLSFPICISGADHEPLEDCPADRACVIFGKDDQKCSFEGKDVNSYVWESDKTTKAKCKYRNYGYVYARLDFKPLNRTSWKVVATLYEKQGSTVKHTPDDYSFTFGSSQLKFIEKNKTQFKWKGSKQKADKNSETPISEDGAFSTVDHYVVDFLNLFGSYEYHLSRYSFEIHSNSEKLITLFGSEVTLDLKGVSKFVIKDAAFTEKLSDLTNCNPSEIKEVCYGTCDKIFSDSKISNSNSTNSSSTLESDSKPNCTSHLWFHSPSETGFYRRWKKVEKLKCYMGFWQANWTEWDGDSTKGTKNIMPSDEVQCSITKPSKMTTIAWVTVGIGAGIGGILLVAGVIALIWFLNKRKRRHHHHHHTERKGTLRDSDSKSRAQTPGGKSTEREKY